MGDKKNAQIQSPLGKAKGLGSSHHGTGHMILHDITTIANIPLVLWVIYSIVTLRDASYEEFTTWMAHPVSIVMAILFVMTAVKHFTLELQVVYEDYIPCKFLRMMKIIGTKLFFFVLAVATIAAIFKVAFTAGV